MLRFASAIASVGICGGVASSLAGRLAGGADGVCGIEDLRAKIHAPAPQLLVRQLFQTPEHRQRESFFRHGGQLLEPRLAELTEV